MSIPAIVVAVRHPDGTQTHIERGTAVFEHDVPASEDTVFNVGSVAKQFTAYLVLLAARSGKFQLDHDARRYVPRLAVPNVTIEQLLTHTSGIRDAESMLSLCGYRDLDHYTADDLLNLMYRQRERAVAPDWFLYSNTNYLLLAKILETVHDTPFDQLAQREVFGPLGMSVTGFRSNPRIVVMNAAESYALEDGVVRADRAVALAGSGSLWTRPRDLLIWLSELHGTWDCEDRLFPLATNLAFHQCGVGDHTYGPGLFAQPGPPAAVFHNGHEFGFSASTYLRRDGLAVACATNAAWIRADDLATRLIRAAGVDDIETAVTAALSPPAPRTPTDRPAAPSIADVTPIATYAASDVPGSVRLARAGDQLQLMRRGTVDPLDADDRSRTTFRGTAMTVTFAEPLTDRPPRSFVLDLERAPGIRYELVDLR